MYYLVITASVVMFSFQFLFNQIYERKNGNSLRSMLFFTLAANAAGLVILFFINKCRLEFTPFSLLMAGAAALNSLVYSYCSIKSLGRINLSLYSVFAMLGGMTLPFIAGIAFFDEELTVGKLVCFAAIAVSLFLTVQKGEGKSGKGYYAGVFIMNGMSGVISKLFQSADYEKTSSAGYSVLIAAWVVVISGIALLFLRKPALHFSPAVIGAAAGCGILSGVANFLLLIALMHVPASAQYPFVTGGVMIISTVISFFTPAKPGKREIVSVALSFAGILALVLL